MFPQKTTCRKHVVFLWRPWADPDLRSAARAAAALSCRAAGAYGEETPQPARADKSIISDSGGIARDYFRPGPAGARPVSAGGGKIDFFSMAGYTILLLMQLLSREVILIFR